MKKIFVAISAFVRRYSLLKEEQSRTQVQVALLVDTINALNAQVQELKEAQDEATDLSDIEERLDDLEEKVGEQDCDDLESRVSSLEDADDVDVDDITERLETLEGRDFDDLSERVEALEEYRAERDRDEEFSEIGGEDDRERARKEEELDAIKTCLRRLAEELEDIDERYC